MKLLCAILAAACCLLAAGPAAAGEPPGATAPAMRPQTTCPVMGGAIDRRYHVDYAGQRVYFCCPDCVAAFRQDPVKYLTRMRQAGETPEAAPAATGAAAPRAAGRAEEEDEEGLRGLVEPLGITTFSLLLLTALTGWTMRRKPRLLRRLHLTLAVLTLAAAATHATLVFLGD